MASARLIRNRDGPACVLHVVRCWTAPMRRAQTAYYDLAHAARGNGHTHMPNCHSHCLVAP